MRKHHNQRRGVAGECQLRGGPVQPSGEAPRVWPLLLHHLQEHRAWQVHSDLQVGDQEARIRQLQVESGPDGDKRSLQRGYRARDQSGALQVCPQRQAQDHRLVHLQPGLATRGYRQFLVG